MNAAYHKVYIFDPCFGSLTGHWENYCKRLYQELTTRELHTTVYGQRDFEQAMVKDMNFSPLFTELPFAHCRNHFEYEQLVNELTRNLEKIPLTQFTANDLLIFHSIFPPFLKALLDWSEKLLASCNLTICLFFQFPPSPTYDHVSSLKNLYYQLRHSLKKPKEISAKMDWVFNQTVRYYQDTIPILRHLILEKKFYLFTSTNTLAKNFSALFDTTVFNLPMPGEKHLFLDENNLHLNETYPKIRVGYFGHSAKEKGGQFLAYIVNRVRLLYPNIQFILHINPNPETEKCLAHFKTVSYDNVECHFGHLDQQKMLTLMKKVDIILMPYSPQKYKTTPSAVFAEAMPLKKIFVLPKKTWVYEEAKKYQAGFVAFKKYDERNITKSLLMAILNFKTLYVKSALAGKYYYDTHNIKNYLDEFFSIVKNPENYLNKEF